MPFSPFSIPVLVPIFFFRMTVVNGANETDVSTPSPRRIVYPSLNSSNRFPFYSAATSFIYFIGFRSNASNCLVRGPLIRRASNKKNKKYST